MPSNSHQQALHQNEVTAAILIQKSVRGLLGRKIFAKQLLQRERGKRKSAKRSNMLNKQQEVSKSRTSVPDEVVVVQAVKKQPIKIASTSQSNTPLIKSNGALSTSTIGRHTSNLLNNDDDDYDNYNPRDSIDSLQQEHHEEKNTAIISSSTQQASQSTVNPKNMMQLSGIQEIDEDMVRDSLNATLRHHLPSQRQDQTTNFSKTKRMADYEELESEFGGVMDSLDMARVTDRSSVAGTVPWPHHHGRSKTVMPADSTSISEQFASVRKLEYDIHEIEDEEKLEDSLEYQIMMKDILSTPRLQAEHTAKAMQSSPSTKKAKLTPPPLSQPPALKPNNHIELFSPTKSTAAPASQGKTKDSTGSVTPSVDVKKQISSSPHLMNYFEDKNDHFSSPNYKNSGNNNVVDQNSGQKPVGAVVSAPLAAAAAGSKIPLSHNSRNQSSSASNNAVIVNKTNNSNINNSNNKQPAVTKVISANFNEKTYNDDLNNEDDLYSANNRHATYGTNNRNTNVEEKEPKQVRKGPPTIKDLLSVMPSEEKSISQQNKRRVDEETKEDKLTQLQKMYFEDVAATFNTNAREKNGRGVNPSDSKLNAVNLALVGSPSKKTRNYGDESHLDKNRDIDNRSYPNVVVQREEEDEGDDLVNLRAQHQKKQQKHQQPPKMSFASEEDNVSVLTDASPFPVNNNRNANNRNIRATSAPRRPNNNSENNNIVPNKKGERRISFSENVQHQSPRVAQNYPEDQGSVYSSGSNNQHGSYSTEHAKLVAAASNLRPPRHTNVVNDNVHNNRVNQQPHYANPNSNNNNNNNNNYINSNNSNNNKKHDAVSSVYHQSQYGAGSGQGGANNNNNRNMKPPPPTTTNNNNHNTAMKSQELEKQLLEEIALLNRKQMLLQEAHHSLQQQPSSPNKRPINIPNNNNNNINNNINNNVNKKNGEIQITPRENASERKAVSAPKTRPKEKDNVDPVKDKEKKAFGWGARDYKPPSVAVKKESKQTNPPVNNINDNNSVNNAINPKEIVQQWKAAAMVDAAPSPNKRHNNIININNSNNNNFNNNMSNNNMNNNNSYNNSNNNNNNNSNQSNDDNDNINNRHVYEQQYSLKQDHLSLAHMHLEAGPGYLQDFHRRKQQQQRSVSAQRGGARGRVVVMDNGDERSFHSNQSNHTVASNHHKSGHRLETVSLPPLLPFQQHQNLAVGPAPQQDTQQGYVHPFAPPNRRVAPPSSRHSTRSAPS